MQIPPGGGGRKNIQKNNPKKINLYKISENLKINKKGDVNPPLNLVRLMQFFITEY